MQVPKTLKEWYEIFTGEKMPSKQQGCQYKEGTYANDIWKMQHKEIVNYKIMDGTFVDATGWARKFFRWLSDNYDYEFGSASTTWFLNKPINKKTA